MKNETFIKEIEYITDPGIRKFTEEAIDCLPTYFWHVAASSSGKFHPPYALGDGGLVRHTIAAVTIAHLLLGLEQNRVLFGTIGSDCIISALLVHDGFKQGVKDDGNGNLAKNHAKICYEFLKTSPILNGYTTDENRDLIADCVRTHMGEWDVKNKPETAHQKFTHMCDYLASRKNIIFDFEARVTTAKDSWTPPVKEEEVVCTDPAVIEITFGKHKGKTVKEVCETNRSYLTWVIENLTTMKPSLKETIEKALKETELL